LQQLADQVIERSIAMSASGTLRIFGSRSAMSAFDPKRTSGNGNKEQKFPGCAQRRLPSLGTNSVENAYLSKVSGQYGDDGNARHSPIL
jgi:hypothetical protein